MPRERPFFQYVIGSFVQLAQGAPMQRVIWRGRQVVPSITGQPQEVAVYRLDNDHWDCYYEYQLHPTLQQVDSPRDRRPRR
ncbi:hypothetical protein HHL22_20305 [Hymenobacter sp. RP-2-7]|uniref:Uncharacterized protein n=1 Tax=Hymenobacter polaris TaxID=2682546 RepID=A0A7Y0AI73_9BACT|nr:hypothetical protein [Hymenobacter polaris]NML67550.1 hypothetical protein [Hymenobacter polaris]